MRAAGEPLAFCAPYVCAMAKQAGNVFIEGSIDDLIFYKMEGRLCEKEKLSYCKEVP